MRIVSIDEAKTQFSELIEAVIHGNEVIIVSAGIPFAKLGPVKEKTKRKFGVLKGKIKIFKDFDIPLSDEILSDFGRSNS